MNVLAWLLFGLLVGLVTTLTGTYMNRRKFFTSLTLGVVGAFLGGFAALFLFDMQLNGFNVLAFFVAAVTSFIFLFFGKRMKQL